MRQNPARSFGFIELLLKSRRSAAFDFRRDIVVRIRIKSLQLSALQPRRAQIDNARNRQLAAAYSEKQQHHE
jgi:hypothetical protein